MGYLVQKIIKDRAYYYEYESIREGDTVRHKYIRYIGKAANVPMQFMDSLKRYQTLNGHADLSANVFIFHGGKNPGKDYKAPQLTDEMLAIAPDCPVAHKRAFYKELKALGSPSEAIKKVYGMWNGRAPCYTWYKNLIKNGFINEVSDDEEVKKYEDNMSKLR